MNSPRIVELPYGILITADDRGNAAVVRSDLLSQFSDPEDDAKDTCAAVASTDAIESLLMALVAAGVDLESEAAQEAVRTSVESLSRYLAD